MATSSLSNDSSTPPQQPQTKEDEVKTARLWDRFAEGYSKSPIKDPDSYETKLKLTQKYFRADTTRVLEFACGTGGTAIRHAPHVKSITAIDISPQMIAIAKENKAQAATTTDTSNLSFLCSGIDSLPETTEPYHVILGMSILHLLPNKKDVLAKVHRNLVPGGYFISSTICLGDNGGTLLKWILPVVSWTGLIPKVSIFTKQELRQSIEESGFDIEEEFHPGNDKAVFLVAKKK